jgi:SAM-dependent methyltransferase
LSTVVENLTGALLSNVTRSLRKRRDGLKKVTPRLVKAIPGVADLQFAAAFCGDARHLALPDRCVDTIITSPPYWRKRDYKVEGQIGQERSPELYVSALVEALREWRRVLRPTGSVFLNIGDTFHKRTLLDIPGRVAEAARQDGWTVRNRIIWVKNTGMPDPAKDRLASRYEHIVHLTPGRRHYYYDLFGYSARYGNGANPGDVWAVEPGVNKSDHLAPFPEEIVDRILALACPGKVCVVCGRPRMRRVKRTAELNPDRPQARRAMEIAQESGLTLRHIAAVQATGISDAGKAKQFQTGTTQNSAEVRKLAAEAKAILGGYFREFTFPRRKSAGWSRCECHKGFMPGVALDPFMGNCTTPRVALRRGFSAVGVDLSQESLEEFKSLMTPLFT